MQRYRVWFLALFFASVESVAALARSGTSVYAWRDQTRDEYYWCIDRVIWTTCPGSG